MKIIIVPGMSCTPVATSNWYSWFATKMTEHPSVTSCILRDFPDPHQCRESVWIPFLENDIGISYETSSGDESTIVVGHSSGAACAMRLLERQRPEARSDGGGGGVLRGVVLVAAAHTDMGDEGERLSEYFNRPWDWEAMKKGADKIALFHGTDDHLIPVREARYVAKKMKGDNFEYYEMTGVSHFFQPWDEILAVVDGMIRGDVNDEL